MLLYRISGHPEGAVYVCNTCGGDGYVRLPMLRTIPSVPRACRVSVRAKTCIAADREWHFLFAALAATVVH